MLEKKRSLISFGLLIPILTVCAFAATYYYELGYFKFYHIPSEFIEIEFSKDSFLIFLLFTSVFVSLFFLDPITGSFYIIKKSRHWVKKIIFAGVVVYFVLIQWKLMVLYFFQKELIVMYITIFLGFMLNAKRLQKENSSGAKIGDLFPMLNALAEYMESILKPALIFTSVVCILMFWAGLTYGNFQTLDVYKKGTNEVLLKYYSSYRIYGVPDSTTKRFTTFIISRSSSDNDTLSIIKKIN
jgi:hypothetical protein